MISFYIKRTVSRIPYRLGLHLLLVVACSAMSLCGRAAEIRLQDSAGNLLKNGRAFWVHEGHAQKMSAATGLFEVPEPVGVVVVHLDGYQYAGLILEKSPSPLTVQLRRAGEKGRACRTRKQTVASVQKEGIKSAIQRKCWEVAKATPATDVQPFAFQLLAQLDPHETIRYLDDHRVNSNADGMARQAAIRQFAKVDLAAALEVLDAVDQPMMRSFMIGEVLKSLPADDSNLSIMEAQMADTIREIDQPALRLASWAVLAEHYAHKGENDKVRTIVQQHLDEAKKLPSGGWTGFPRSLFASLIVDDQPELAIEMIDGIDQGHEKARALARLAFNCSKPDHAKELLGKIDKGQLIGYPYVSRVAYKLAADDAEAAISIAKTIPDAKHRAWALGLVGHRLSDRDPETARAVLQEAVNDVEEACRAKVRTYVSPGEVMAGLLPIAEVVDPGNLESMIWQSVWATVPSTRWRDGSETFTAQIESVAAAVARYDQKLAKALCPDVSLSRDANPVLTSFTARTAINHIALDPQSLAEYLATLEFTSQSYRGYESAVKVLLADEGQFWNLVSQPNLLQIPSDRFEEF